VVLLAVLAIGIWAISKFFLNSGPIESTVPTAVVRKINLRDTVIERGTLESQQSIDIVCEMNGWDNKILFILPEGTIVRKNELVVELDSTQLEQDISEAQSAVTEGETQVENAIQELKVQENENESAIRLAEQALDFAKLDRNKYINGDYIVTLSDYEAAISEAITNVGKARRDAENTKILVEKGFRGFEQMRDADQQLKSAELRLRQSKQKKAMLEKYDHVKSMRQYDSGVEEADFKLETQKTTALAKLAQKKRMVEGQKEGLKLQKERLKLLTENLSKSEIRAPAEGTLTYANERWWGRDEQIREGGSVREGQTIMSLPNMRKMQVEVGVHESLVSKVKVKQPAAIRIDSYPNRSFTGEVKTVAPLAESSWNATAKNYQTMITIEEIPEDVDLKPGMTAQVELLIGYYPNAIVVPVQAVASHKDKSYVYVETKTNEFERREIVTGNSNVSFVEATEGIAVGEKVALDAFQRAADDFGDLEDDEDGSLSSAAAALDTEVLKEIEEEEAEREAAAAAARLLEEAGDPEAPPTPTEREPDPEAPPTPALPEPEGVDDEDEDGEDEDEDSEDEADEPSTIGTVSESPVIQSLEIIK
jgi:HlyD family secretion protein